MSNKPNILYIFPDQHRGDAMGCVGHPSVITPSLNRLSKESAVFERCSTNSPLCMPARASMMTGQYVCEHGIWSNNAAADPKGPSHVRNVRDAGYHTALVGKTHLYVHGGRDSAHHSNDFVPVLNDWGFDDVLEVHGPIASGTHDSPYTDYLKAKGLLDVHRKYIRDYWKEWSTGQAKPWDEEPSPLSDKDHLDAYAGQQAIDWINNYKDDKPFYLQVLFPGPHDPFDSTKNYRALYNPDRIPVGLMNAPEDPIPSYVQRVMAWSGIKDIMTRDDKRLMSAFYFAKITLIDEYIGRIVDALENNGLADNTWIVYCSDHGEMLGDHQMSHKIVFYESALRIPCIIRPPKGMEGWKSRGLTDQLDVTATIADIAGAEPMTDSDGRSLKQQVLDGPEAADAQNGKQYIFSDVVGFSMVRDDRHKLAIDVDKREPVELFDLESDADEDKNVVNDSAYESVKQNLLEVHMERLKKRLDVGKFMKFRGADPASGSGVKAMQKDSGK